jgi:hypothetical protein
MKTFLKKNYWDNDNLDQFQSLRDLGIDSIKFNNF